MVLMTYVALSMLGLPMHRLGGCEHSDHPAATPRHDHLTDEQSNCGSESAAAASPRSNGTVSRSKTAPAPQGNSGHSCTCNHPPASPPPAAASKTRTTVGAATLPDAGQSSSTVPPGTLPPGYQNEWNAESEWNAEHHHAQCVVCEQIRSLSQHVVIDSTIGMAGSAITHLPSPIRLSVESNRERATLSSRGPPLGFA